MSLRLDLGSGSRPREGYVGVDIAALENVVAFDLTSGNKWPWKDGEIEELSSSHFIEHIAADYVEVMRSGTPYRKHDEMNIMVERVLQDRLFFFFDEAFRVIKPGGLFHVTWPSLKSSDAFRDPTHRRFIPLEFTHYLSKAGRDAMGLQHYVVSCNWLAVDGSIFLHSDTELPRRIPLGESRSSIAAEAQLTRDPWNEQEWNRLWDVQKAWQVTLRAEK